MNQPSKQHKETHRPYVCLIELIVPTPQQAICVADATGGQTHQQVNNQRAFQLQRILQVDRELTNNVVKEFHTVDNTLQVTFRATQAKFLRVAVSSFLDYVTVALKVFQEFE